MFGWKRKIEAEISNIYQILAQRDATLQSMTTNVASLRGLINRKLGGNTKVGEETKAEEEEYSKKQILKDLEEVRKAFDGDLPIELREKYNNYEIFKE
jgi:hypothetical protein